MQVQLRVEVKALVEGWLWGLGDLSVLGVSFFLVGECDNPTN